MTTEVEAVDPLVAAVNDLCLRCHNTASTKGFWDSSVMEKLGLAGKLMLVVSELGEALEASRNSDFDNFCEELADTCIRIFDLAGAFNIHLGDVIAAKMEKNEQRPYLHGKEY